MFNIPFTDQTFDCVWNAGVLEHFRKRKQIETLAEMKRVCKPGGSVICLCPNRRSLPYLMGKTWAEMRGTWNFGYEKPVSSLRSQFHQIGIEHVVEYPVGPEISLDYLRRLPHPVQRLLDRDFFRRFFESLGPGGYLLVSVGRRV